MKSKIFTLFAAFVLLFSAQASAQTNGDVNDDGKVDEQDIAAILEIMAEAGGVKEPTKYYWYAGQTAPTSMNTNPTVDDVNFTNNKWHTLADDATQIKQGITGGTKGNNWYVAFPESFGFEMKASDLKTTDTTATKLSNITINGKAYNVYKSNSIAARTTVYAAKK